MAELTIGEQVSKRVHKHEGEVVLTTTLRRPAWTTNGTARPEASCARLASVCKARWEGPLLAAAIAEYNACRAESRPFSPWEAALDFRVPCLRDGLLSLFFDLSETRGDRRPTVERTAFTWELPSGTPRTLRSFFPKGRHAKRLVLRALTEQVQERIQSGETLYDPDCLSRLPALFSPDRFYITEQGLALFFPMYSIAPFAEGIPVFLLPMPEDL